MSNKNIVFAPISKPQEEFLKNDGTFFTVYGGGLRLRLKTYLIR